MSEWLQPPYEPQETSDVDRAFPADYQRLMPDPLEIPAFRRGASGSWSELTMHWMTNGWSETAQFAPQPGVDAEKAFWHLQCVIGSYGPKHQHKEATVAFLARRWFVGIKDHGELLFGQDFKVAR